MQIVLCAFAGGGDVYRESLARLKNEARGVNFFDDYFCYTDLDAPAIITNQIASNKEFYKNRGFGYWTWKPILIEYVLEKINENDILIYVDAGCQLSSYGKKRFSEYIHHIKKFDSLFFHMPPNIEEAYTAKKIVDYLNCPLEHLKTPQIQATFFGIKKTTKTINFIYRWKELSLLNNGYLINDANIFPTSTNFVDYRHDQSILSLLVKLNNIETIPYECHYKSIEYYPNSAILRFPVHSVRNRTGDTKDRHTFKYSSYNIINSNSLVCTIVKYATKIIYLTPKFFRYVKNRFNNFFSCVR
jgi:hypothetical protein